jgi:O-antigen ligase
MIIAYILIAAGVVYLFSKLDPRMADVFSIQTLKTGGFTKYADLLKFGERITYWQTGWRVYNQHPVLGVGVGNAGFYFKELLPDPAWQLSEVRTLLYHSTNLMNIKSLWVRVLAETGFVGFSFFMIFLLVSLLTASVLTRSNERQSNHRLDGISMLIAFLLKVSAWIVLPYLIFGLLWVW